MNTNQYEYCEQQSPHLDPWQLKPPVAPKALPQRALVETLIVDEAAAADEDRVLVRSVEDERVLVRRVVERPGDEVQVPKAGLQPVPQWSEKDE